jgi:cell wall-associated NlpC family hydrolase
MLSRVKEMIEAVLGDLSMDSRTCFADARLGPPDGKNLIVECSDSEALSEIRRRLASAAVPGGPIPQFVLLPDPREGLAEVYLVVNSVADVRRAPAHAAELITQAVCRELVEALKKDGGWTLGRLGDGYLGWMRDWHLRPSSREAWGAFEQAAQWRIRDNVAQIVETPDNEAPAVSDAVIGTPVVLGASQRRGWRLVTLPGGRDGYVRSRSVERRPRRRASRERLVSTGMGFLGIPYLWGGKTPKGFDCSGLIQTLFSLCGIALPRDSDLQALAAPCREAGDISSLATGNLLFFGKEGSRITHVAVHLSEGDFLHAHGCVRVNSLNSTSPLFDKKLGGDWRFFNAPLSL